MRIVYLIGVPGSGKTTLLNAALDHLAWGTPTQLDLPIPHLDYGNRRIQLGRLRDNGFSGTDALGMAINPRAIDFISTRPADIIVAEGDRLANQPFLAAAAQHADLHLVWLDTPPQTARQRSNTRAQHHGHQPQPETWWKSRLTKTARLAGGHPHTRLDGNQPLPTLTQQLAHLITN